MSQAYSLIEWLVQSSDKETQKLRMDNIGSCGRWHEYSNQLIFRLDVNNLLHADAVILRDTEHYPGFSLEFLKVGPVENTLLFEAKEPKGENLRATFERITGLSFGW